MCLCLCVTTMMRERGVGIGLCRPNRRGRKVRKERAYLFARPFDQSEGALVGDGLLDRLTNRNRALISDGCVGGR